MSFFILGSTGLVGNETLKAGNEESQITSIATVGRRLPKVTSGKIKSVEEKNTELWPEIITREAKGFDTFISAFGTTRAAAGGIENFRKIDYGVNYASAKAAKEAGVETFVLVSSGGANAKSWFPYMSIKGKLEDDIIKLQFPRTIILRPGILLGEREVSKGLLDHAVVSVGKLLTATPYAVWSEVVGQAAINAALEPYTKADAPLVKFVEGKAINHLAKK